MCVSWFTMFFFLGKNRLSKFNGDQRALIEACRKFIFLKFKNFSNSHKPGMTHHVVINWWQGCSYRVDKFIMKETVHYDANPCRGDMYPLYIKHLKTDCNLSLLISIWWWFFFMACWSKVSDYLYAVWFIY